MKDQIEKAIDLILEQDQNEFLDSLKARGINYTVRSDGLVDVDGNIDLNDVQLKKLPIKFGVVTGSFDCSHNLLTSLQGAPEEVKVWFDCSENQLTNLQGCPKKVGNWFDCSDNQLISLEGAPGKMEGGFYCSTNQLTSLEGCPKEVKGSFTCSNNKLTSLEGCPQDLSGNSFICNHNLLTSLRGCPKKVAKDNFYCGNNPVEFTKEDIELAKQGKAPLGLPLSWVLMKKKEKEFKEKS